MSLDEGESRGRLLGKSPGFHKLATLPGPPRSNGMGEPNRPLKRPLKGAIRPAAPAAGPKPEGAPAAKKLPVLGSPSAAPPPRFS